jgi:hypothetical protein
MSRKYGRLPPIASSEAMMAIVSFIVIQYSTAGIKSYLLVNY